MSIEFEISINAYHTILESVDAWDDVSHKQNLDLFSRGTGVGNGAMALKVLRGFNIPRP